MKRNKRTFAARYTIPTPEENERELQRVELLNGDRPCWTYIEPENKNYKASIMGVHFITWFSGKTLQELLDNFTKWVRVTREDNEIMLIEKGIPAHQRTLQLDHIIYYMRLDILTQIALQISSSDYEDLPGLSK